MCAHAQYIQFINEIVHFINLQINSKKKFKKNSRNISIYISYMLMKLKKLN